MQRDEQTSAEARDAEASAPRAFTFEAVSAPAERGGAWRRIPALTRDALAMVWRAAPRQFMTTVALQVVVAALVGVQLLVGRELVQDLIAVSDDDRAASTLVPAFALLIGATALAGVVAALIAHQQRLLSELVARYAFEEIIGVAATVELQSFEDPAFHDQLERAKISGLQRPVAMVTNVVGLGTALLTSLGVAAVLATLEPLLLALALAAGVPVLLATLVNSRHAYAFEWLLTHQSRERYYLMELLTGKDTAKELRAFDATAFLRGRFDELTQDRLRALRGFLRRRLRISLVGSAGTSVGTAIALGSLVWLLASDRIDVATAVAAGVSMQLLASRIATITASVGSLVESGMFLDDFHTFLALGREEQRRLASTAARAPAPPRFAGVRVEDVSFAYPRTDRRVLEDVTLEVGPGEIVALVGENGSGKTTLVKLICGLYHPDAGRVLWGGADAAGLDPRSVRDNVTVLFQDFVQYHLTARENIALGRIERDALPEAVEAAARKAGAHELVSRLPAAYDTRLGRQFYGGFELSVGQWQRLALARAFFRDGEFLVLDEPTASLDPRAEHDLFVQMRRLAAGRSVLLISHRFSSVRSADRIYVLHAGRIVEVGTHDELTASGGRYAELFRLQSEAYLAREPAG